MKTYSMSDLVIIAAVPFVRTRPEMFFRSGRPNALECAQHLAGEALALGIADVLIADQENWWCVSGSGDWFVGTEPVRQEVQRLLPLPKLMPNSSRTEVVIFAFSAGMTTRVGPGAWELLKGETAPPDSVGAKTLAGRQVAFWFDGSD